MSKILVLKMCEIILVLKQRVKNISVKNIRVKNFSVKKW